MVKNSFWKLSIAIAVLAIVMSGFVGCAVAQTSQANILVVAVNGWSSSSNKQLEIGHITQ